MKCTVFKYAVSHIVEFRRGRYLTIVIPMACESRGAAYQVLVFEGTTEVYAQQEPDLFEAIRTATAYLDWKMDHNTDELSPGVAVAQVA